MKHTETHQLSQVQRRLLQLGVIFVLALFLLGYFLLINRKQTQEPAVKNQTVFIQDATLHAFDDISMIMDYTDKISIHYPYLLFAKTQANTTHIYNLMQKKEEKQLKTILLDYTGTNQLANQGKTTFLNTQDLGVFCEKGFIKNSDDILCVTKTTSVKGDIYKVVRISPKNKKQIVAYVSKGIITNAEEIQSKLYIGEIDPNTNKSYLIIDNNRIEVSNLWRRN